MARCDAAAVTDAQGVSTMDLDSFALFRIISRNLDWTAERQGLLAQNIANADTPGYRPRDIEPFAEHLRNAERASVPLQRHHELHLAGNGGAGATAPGSSAVADTYEVSPTGNEVILEQQMISMAETAMQHQLATSLFRKHIGMFQTALGRSGR